MIQTPKINLIHGDCMELMQQTPDGHYSLGIVDPPYGGGQHFNFRFGTGDQVYRNDKPDPQYFTEVLRVCKNVIVWGGNYFTDMLPVSRCWISWYKGNPLASFSDFELAWTNFDQVSRAVKLESYGFRHADKKTELKTIHPTQKPASLYRWILENYTKPDDKILDTHLGSMSIAIACFDLGFDLTGTELDKDYYDAGVARFERHRAQGQLFHAPATQLPEQQKMF